MNTLTTSAALLLPLLSAGLAAQELGFQIVASAKRIAAGIDGAPKGHVVVLVLGMRQHPTPLPDGQVLGVSPDVLAGCAVASGSGPTMMEITSLHLDVELRFHAQAVAFDPALPLDAQQMALSPVETVAVCGR